MGQLWDWCWGNIEEDAIEDELIGISNEQNVVKKYRSFKNLRKIALDKLGVFPKVQKAVEHVLPSLHFKWPAMQHRGTYNKRTKYVHVNELFRGKKVAIGILLHELIHSIGGTELDAEFFENVCCDASEGAVRPTESRTEDDDYDDFASRGSKIVQIKLKSIRNRRYVVEYEGIEHVFQGKLTTTLV